MKKLLLLLLPVYLLAQILQVGDEVSIVKLKSQHDREYTLVDSGVWIITWDKISTRTANKYFNNQEMPKDINLLVDVSQAPSGIFNLFILPDMKRYKHPILLSFNELYNVKLPYKENHLTLLYIENKKIVKIDYLKDESELTKQLSSYHQ